MSGEVRHRARSTKSKPLSSSSSNGFFSDEDSKNKDRPIEEIHWFIVTIVLIVMFVIGSNFETSCEDVPWSDSPPSINNKQVFQESIARGHLWNFTRFGPHPAGSEINEVILPKFLKNELNKYTGKSFGDLSAELNDHISDFGSFTLEDSLHPGNVVHLAYENIRNIAFRISSKKRPKPEEKRSAILINCHYDSFVGSPGATDDAVSCSSMLETIRVILEIQPVMQHDLIFLFNGAEEHLLMSSHAFVTQHPWMKYIKMFVNLEGNGAGGRQLVFQSGPGNAWIMEEYARTARQPFASIMGAEVFSSGLIPSDTDFRIFRDFGKIPGIDLAYISNGHVYHTPMDEEKRIPPACLRNSGENLVRLLVELVNSPYVTHSGDYHTKRLVFFDVLGLFMVTYSETVYYCTNILIILMIYLRSSLRILKFPDQFRMLWIAVINQIVSLIGFSCVLVGVGSFIHVFLRRMCWFTFRFNLVGVFVLPVIMYCLTHHGTFVRRFKIWPTSVLAKRSHFEATQIIVCTILLIVTCLRYLSGYVLIPWIIFPFLGDLLIERITKNMHIPNSGLKVQFVYPIFTMLVIGVAYMYNVYMSQVLLEVFIPIMGRSGASVYPDVFVGAILIVPLSVPTLYLSCDIYLTNITTIRRMRTFIFNLFISYLVLVNVTRIGFQFDGSLEQPRQHRMAIVHSAFTYRNHLGEVQSTANKLIFTSCDMSEAHPITDVMPDMSPADLSTFKCRREPYCGFPHLYPISNIYLDIRYLTLKEPHHLEPSLALNILKKEAIDDTTYNVTMSMSGPSTTHIYFMTENGVDLLKWSFEPTSTSPPLPSPVPRETSEKHYFIMNLYGSKPEKPLEFWALFHVDRSLPDEQAEVLVSLNGFYLHQPGHTTAPMKNVIDRLPSWVTEIHWASSYDLSVVRFRH